MGLVDFTPRGHPAVPHRQNNVVCKHYSVYIIRMCPFYHTATLALSMIWKVGKGIKYDYRSQQI